MSFNSSLANASGLALSTETASVPSSEHLPTFDPTIAAQTVDQSPLQQANKKRRPSKGKVQTDLRRVSSTPHMRNLALQTTAGDLSPTADKRRNKLGYHRTSVACGHCRRRKIRCLVAQDDPQGRCANCIRLKKECNFYPVEQNPENQPRAPTTASTETGSGAPVSSTTSSPHHPSAAGEKVDEFRPPFPGPPLQTSKFAAQPDVEIDPNLSGPPSAMQLQHPPYTYPPAIETQWNTPAYLPSSSVAESSPSSSGFWQPSPSTANSAYGSDSNVSGGRTPATMSTASTMSYAGHQDPHGWNQPSMQPPGRSMSFPNIEGVGPSQYANPGLGIQHDYSRRTSPYPYPTTIDTNPATLHSTTTLGSNGSAPLSAPILPNQHQQFNYPAPWNPFGGMPQSAGHEMPAQPRSMSVQWYHESGQLGQVQEESGQPVGYPNGMPHQFYTGS
ncbi:hypothetical protein BU24DRAFT_345404 [Aaosphaeria arxii CBS 175.79]|uniref:Zn(2)-C6 fungal-type domain-containing protein n=1 Tax=Aaosphaeria arxii CBS 175.79 TaxID=1450172 RepID=A0A6A5XW18_9PLEO|nr:uncharacterized protein BU24DRAFT_345404 [Aaosphaeria arxii CBS 175.79]KAF2017169.1 hypothetical protein BU24DRAFT_345404 [Aaosphaeria arxii CBS 175.79]